MYNPDFWEVRLDPTDLDHYPNEAGIWFEKDEYPVRRQRDSHLSEVMRPLMDLIDAGLTDKQRQAVTLYFLHQKTQDEVAQIMGVSRRVVSQHLFGIYRNGKHIGGAIPKMRKLCQQRGICPQTNRLEPQLN
jgi:DNA-directed RNA polymerase sigma subunit (sigma70/sigma32)